jgi:hypothetical protein
MRNPFYAFCVLILIFGASACSSLLPEKHVNSTPFQSFDEARAAIEALVPMQSTRQEFERNGFNPNQHPNLKLLTHSDVVRRLVPSALLKREDLDLGILACLEARDACRGLEINIEKIDRTRIGNFFLDFFDFERRVLVTGWRFNATILFVNDRVVYRTWGGQPKVNETEDARKPFGFLQG